MIRSVKLDDYVETYQWMVFQTCRRHTANTDAAWEAYQDTFLALTRRHESLDLTEDLGPWLRETARRCCQAVTRRRYKTEFAPLQVEPLVPGESQQNQVEFDELAEILQQELAELNENDRLILQLVYRDQKTNREVASEIGCPKGSVHARIETATSNLRRRMRKRGVAIAMLVFLLFLWQERVAVAAESEMESEAEQDSSLALKAKKDVPLLVLFSIAVSVAIAIVTLVSVSEAGAGAAQVVAPPTTVLQPPTVPATRESASTEEEDCSCG